MQAQLLLWHAGELVKRDSGQPGDVAVQGIIRALAAGQKSDPRRAGAAGYRLL
ncbi:hypothetical protein JVB16_13870 [Enterobacter hormaechei]|nr:hypothetical protein [Enterobacter hormaechei]MXS65724.1 hypothetical protein [Enterobacter hormaechei]